MNVKNLILLGTMTLISSTCAVHQTKKQTTDSAFVPKGYKLVWNDEFESSYSALPDTSIWDYDTGGDGWGNAELQYYVPAIHTTDTVALLNKGILNIIARMTHETLEGHNYLSARMKTKQSWKYGYFEARMMMPEGRGTWAAFWMLPKDFEHWPLDGEIDIMEHLGSHPDSIHISTHTQRYNHAFGTQKTSITAVKNVQHEFHIYGLEWTENEIKGYIDGTLCFRHTNDGKMDKATWPFDVPFRMLLNQAVGGWFGGKKGVDNSCFPATFQIDYIRVYQKLITNDNE